MTIKKVDTGKHYRFSFLFSLIYFAAMALLLHFLYPTFDILNPSSFVEMIAIAATAMIPLSLYFLNRPYRSSVSWTIKIPMSSEMVQEYLQPNIDNTVSVIQDKLSTDWYLVEKHNYDGYDRFFERGDSVKLVSEDSFVIYVNGDVNRFGIINLRVMLRILSLDKEAIKRLNQQLESAVNEVRPITN